MACQVLYIALAIYFIIPISVAQLETAQPLTSPSPPENPSPATEHREGFGIAISNLIAQSFISEFTEKLYLFQHTPTETPSRSLQTLNERLSLKKKLLNFWRSVLRTFTRPKSTPEASAASKSAFEAASKVTELILALEHTREQLVRLYLIDTSPYLRPWYRVFYNYIKPPHSSPQLESGPLVCPTPQSPLHIGDPNECPLDQTSTQDTYQTVIREALDQFVAFVSRMEVNDSELILESANKFVKTVHFIYPQNKPKSFWSKLWDDSVYILGYVADGILVSVSSVFRIVKSMATNYLDPICWGYVRLTEPFYDGLPGLKEYDGDDYEYNDNHFSPEQSLQRCADILQIRIDPAFSYSFPIMLREIMRRHLNQLTNLLKAEAKFRRNLSYYLLWLQFRLNLKRYFSSARRQFNNFITVIATQKQFTTEHLQISSGTPHSSDQSRNVLIEELLNRSANPLNYSQLFERHWGEYVNGTSTDQHWALLKSHLLFAFDEAFFLMGEKGRYLTFALAILFAAYLIRLVILRLVPLIANCGREILKALYSARQMVRGTTNTNETGFPATTTTTTANSNVDSDLLNPRCSQSVTDRSTPRRNSVEGSSHNDVIELDNDEDDSIPSMDLANQVVSSQVQERGALRQGMDSSRYTSFANMSMSGKSTATKSTKVTGQVNDTSEDSSVVFVSSMLRQKTPPSARRAFNQGSAMVVDDSDDTHTLMEIDTNATPRRSARIADTQNLSVENIIDGQRPHVKPTRTSISSTDTSTGGSSSAGGRRSTPRRVRSSLIMEQNEARPVGRPMNRKIRRAADGAPGQRR